MASLVERLVAESNSSLIADDVAELKKLSPETLKRVAIGLLHGMMSVTNEDKSDEQKKGLLDDLTACRQDILNLLSTEQSIRKELEPFGIHEPPVIEQFLPVMNSASGELTEEAVMEYVNKSPSVTGMALREGMAARQLSRTQAIETIMGNSDVYTVEELRVKHTPELQKLAEFVQQARRTPQEVSVCNYEGLGLADQSVSQANGTRWGATLDLPSSLR